MKKIVQINVTCNGSTGRIMEQIQKKATESGYKAISFYGRGNPSNKECIKIDTQIEILWHVLIARLLNLQGHGSIFATYRMIKKIKKIQPDIIHLHNLHGYYINLKMLFKFLKKQNIPIIWTLHDCWAFTGHCAYYTANNCEKWKSLCDNCKYKNMYPEAYFFGNRAKKEYLLKKKLISEIKNLTITVPSHWLKGQVNNSYLKERQTEVVHNCIETNVFKPIEYTDIKKKYNIDLNKKIILGVAAQWGKNKGIEYFKELSEIIDNEKEVIVMVGLTDKQIQAMPENIIGINRTENIEELVNIYSMADVFFNPSIQETFSMVTIEAIACGTPCLVMDSTATPELVNENIGRILKKQEFSDMKKIYKEIQEMIKKGKNTNACVEQAQKYDIENYQKYINLYKNIISK